MATPVRLSRSQLGTGALVVAALSVGQFINDRLPARNDGSRLFAQEVVVGDTVPLRTGDLRVFSVEGATSVLREFSGSIRSPGVVLVVTFTFTPKQESTGIGYAELVGGDGSITRFSSFGSRNKVSCPAGPVDVTSLCTAVVEVDPDALPGARLQLSKDPLDPRYDSMADVDLQISTDEVERWQTIEELPVESSRVMGR